MILIKDGRVIDPQRGIDDVLDIQIEGNKIRKIGKYQRNDDYERIIEAKGMIVAPGFIDVHSHFRDPGFTYKEDILTGAKAAAKGGYTTVICMANTNPVIDNEETIKYVLDKGEETGIHVLTCATISKGMEGKELVDMKALKAAGAIGFTDDGKPLMDEKLVLEAMKKAKELGVVLSFHEEDPNFITNNGIHHGAVSEKLGIEGSPAVAEDVMVARDCMMALSTGARINIQHISSGHAVEIVRLAKKLGADVWAEVTPHHFSLNDDAVLQYGTLAKMNPPLRTKEDRYEIIEGIKEGVIDVIATDHAPHSEEEKSKPLTEAPSGIIGLETALALGITMLVRKGHITIRRLVEMMSLRPATLYGLQKGYLDEGADADLVIFSDTEKWLVDQFESKASNSPFKGTELYGKVKYTVCNGQVVYEDLEKE